MHLDGETGVTNSMSVFLGIDVGTSGTKTLAISEDGKILARDTVEYPLFTPEPGWSEQKPEHWWQATIQSVRKVIGTADIKPADVKGIGLSGQMHGSVFLNSEKEVIRDAMLWNDQRTQAECDEIESRAGGKSALIDMVSNPALTGFTAPKILWLRNNEPEHYEQIEQILLPKDYVRFRLTGLFATEASDASGTLLLDVKARDWCQPLLTKLEIDPAWLPDVFESEVVSGTLSEVAGQLLGLPAGIPVVGGGGDQAAGAVGNGIVRSGSISATMGTSGVVFAHSDEVQTDPEGRVHTFCHAVNGKWHVMGVVLSAGGSLQWYRNEFGEMESAIAKGMDTEAYELMTAAASKAPAGSEGLYFLPYLTGERTPHCDSYCRAAFIGLSLRHKRAHMIRSVMEGATYAMRDCLEIIDNMSIPISEIRVSGGGARSVFWRQLQADIYGQDVSVTNSDEGPAYGVALLAAVGTGAYSNIEEACSATIQVTGTTETCSETKDAYDRTYPMYGKLYESLKGNFPEICELANG
jgi:xylulokinase